MKDLNTVRVIGGAIVSTVAVRFIDTIHHMMYVENHTVLNATYSQMQSANNGVMVFSLLKAVAICGIMYGALKLKRKK